FLLKNVFAGERNSSLMIHFTAKSLPVKPISAMLYVNSQHLIRMTHTYFDNDQKILRAASDISASVARADLDAAQYESWRFEAVSDDGEKVISIVFLEDLL